MALTNAEKQRRWRAAHAKRRRSVARVAAMLSRNAFAERKTHPVRVGMVQIDVDQYFLKLADLISEALSPDKTVKQDRRVKQLSWALLHRLRFRKEERKAKREPDPQARALREHFIRSQLGLVEP
jgi:hypothetical protein